MGRPHRHAGRDLSGGTDEPTDDERSACAREGWREDDSALFIDYGRAFTPERERQQAIICELVASVAPRRVVELCCGAGELLGCCWSACPRLGRWRSTARRPCWRRPRRPAPRMRDRLELRRSISRRATGGSCSRRPMRSAARSRSITSMAKAKRQLFKDLHAALRPGGVFVLADLIRPDSDAGWRIAAEDWDRAVAERSVQIYGDDRAQRKFAELRWNYLSLAGRQHDRSSVLGRRARRVARRGRLRSDRAALAARRPRDLLRAQGLIAGMARARARSRRMVTYLEMTAPPAGAPLPPPRAGIEVRRAVRPTVGFYRYLYDAIGAEWTLVRAQAAG